jgi:hypothetical protein
MVEYFDTYDEAMRSAQDLHGQGNFVDARETWQQAEALAPDELCQGRAIRGDAASAGKLYLFDEAVERAQLALRIHSQLRAEDPSSPIYLREEVQSQGVTSRQILRTIAIEEKYGKVPFERAMEEAFLPLTGITRAYDRIRSIGKEAGCIDQYEINIVPHVAMGHGLYGEADVARALATEARRVAKFTEAVGSPTSASISPAYRGRSMARAVLHATAASTVATFGASPANRKFALAVALSRFGF